MHGEAPRAGAGEYEPGSQSRRLVDGSQAGSRAVHGDVPVGQADQVVLGHRLHQTARLGDVAHAQAPGRAVI